MFGCGLCGTDEVHRADRAAEIIWQNQSGRYRGLPRKLQGVWWMDGNPAPELFASLDGNPFHPKRRTVEIVLGAPLNWSFNNSTWGYLEACAVCLGHHLLCNKIEAQFNPDYTYANLPLTICCGAVDLGRLLFRQAWVMQEVDDNTWHRLAHNYVCCCCCMDPTPEFMYTLRKVIDADGRELPALGQIMAQLTGMAPSEVSKTLEQVILVPAGLDTRLLSLPFAAAGDFRTDSGRLGHPARAHPPSAGWMQPLASDTPRSITEP
mmetsp:Transcript_53951/g.156746  ORF Transcript_53951/g.156746 Transcript_53951/m.156746 type:complete len:264 (-) Transcript_53951:5-796(-)